jgi:hypothetical protein
MQDVIVLSGGVVSGASRGLGRSGPAFDGFDLPRLPPARGADRCRPPEPMPL